MWLAGVRDLQWRARRLLIAVGGAALVFAITLQLSGFRSAFDVEAAALIDGFGAAGYVVRAEADSPFVPAPLPASLADELVAAGAVGRADPVVTLRQELTAPTELGVYVIGHRPGGIGAPVVAEGRVPAAAGELAIDRSAAIELGTAVVLGGRDYTVVGLLEGRTLYFGLPIAYALVTDVQAATFGGQPLATSILVDGEPTALAADYRVATPEESREGVGMVLESAITVVTILRLFLWTVAAAIIASLLYVSVLERARDIAVFKATGVGNGVLALVLTSQSVLLSVTAAIAASTLAVLSRPVFPVALSLPATTHLGLAAVAVAVGLLATGAALRRALAIDPAAAFRGP